MADFRDMVAVLKWSSAAINRFWRIVYGSGIWLHQTVARQLVDDGWGFIDSCFIDQLPPRIFWDMYCIFGYIV